MQITINIVSLIPIRNEIDTTLHVKILPMTYRSPVGVEEFIKSIIFAMFSDDKGVAVQ